jgi:hypothetical protein
MVRHIESFRANGRKLQSGDLVRIATAPRSRLYKVRHLRMTATSISVELYGPVDKWGRRKPRAQYLAVRPEDIVAKARGAA